MPLSRREERGLCVVMPPLPTTVGDEEDGVIRDRRFSSYGFGFCARTCCCICRMSTVDGSLLDRGSGSGSVM